MPEAPYLVTLNAKLDTLVSEARNIQHALDLLIETATNLKEDVGAVVEAIRTYQTAECSAEAALAEAKRVRAEGRIN